MTFRNQPRTLRTCHRDQALPTANASMGETCPCCDDSTTASRRPPQSRSWPILRIRCLLVGAGSLLTLRSIELSRPVQTGSLESALATATAWPLPLRSNCLRRLDRAARRCRPRTPAATRSRWSIRLLIHGRRCRCLLDVGLRELPPTGAWMASGLEVGLLRFRDAAAQAGGVPPRPQGFPTGSEFESGADVHHRRAPGVDRADDLLGVDPLEVHAGCRHIRMLDMRVIWQLGERFCRGPGRPGFSAGSGYAVGA